MDINFLLFITHLKNKNMNDNTKSAMQAIIEAAKAKAAANTPQNFSNSTGTPAPEQTPAAPAPTPAKVVPGKIYSLLGANGAIMQEIKRVTLPLHCQIFMIGSGSDTTAATIEPANANGRQKVVVLSEHRPRYSFIDVKYMQPYSKKFGIGNYYSDTFKTFSAEIVQKYCTLADQALNTAPAAPQSIDDILNNVINTQEEETAPPAPAKPSIYIEMPKVAPAPEPITIAPPPAPKAITNGVYTMSAYFVVTGKQAADTIKIKEELRRLGGTYSGSLDCGSGWIFPMKKMFTVKKFLGLV